MTGIYKFGSTLVTVGWDDCLRFSDVQTKASIGSSPLNGQPACLSGSSKVSDIFAVVTNKDISLYKGKEVIASLTGFTFTPFCASIKDDNEIAIGCEDAKTRIYSISKGAFNEIHVIETRTPVTALAYSPNGSFLAIGTFISIYYDEYY